MKPPAITPLPLPQSKDPTIELIRAALKELGMRVGAIEARMDRFESMQSDTQTTQIELHATMQGLVSRVEELSDLIRRVLPPTE